MKKALVSYQGYVGKIVDPGEEGPIYEGPDATIAWVDAPDNIQMDWTLEWSPQQQIMVWVERDGPYTNHEVARKVAYGTEGAQLGMIYDAIKENGVLDSNSDWYQHQVLVKSMIPKPTGADPYQFETMEEKMARALVEEPDPAKPSVPSTPEMQSWKRYPGWKGFQGEFLAIPANARVNHADGFLYSEGGAKLGLASEYGIYNETDLDKQVTWYGPDDNPFPIF